MHFLSLYIVAHIFYTMFQSNEYLVHDLVIHVQILKIFRFKFRFRDSMVGLGRLGENIQERQILPDWYIMTSFRPNNLKIIRF